MGAVILYLALGSPDALGTPTAGMDVRNADFIIEPGIRDYQRVRGFVVAGNGSNDPYQRSYIDLLPLTRYKGSIRDSTAGALSWSGKQPISSFNCGKKTGYLLSFVILDMNGARGLCFGSMPLINEMLDL